jgi:hypothetical protein
MRKITKSAVPLVLHESADAWTADFIADPANRTKKYRYRHADIKSALVAETDNKCVYCESKIGHNTPGDVEHKIPTSADLAQHFSWPNLTIACTECNRRKNDYYEPGKPFLDPYSDDVDARVIHHGPTVGWPPGDGPAEITVRILEFNDFASRKELIARKIETIDRLNITVARLSEADPLIQELMRQSIEKMKAQSAEYSGMVRAICNTYGI